MTLSWALPSDMWHLCVNLSLDNEMKQNVGAHTHTHASTHMHTLPPYSHSVNMAEAAVWHTDF